MKKIVLVLSLCIAFLLSIPFLGQASPLAYTTERISGQDRIETALSIAQKGWTTAQTVILCEGTDYPDSIAVAPYAVNLDAPILLTGGDTLDQRVETELQRLNPQKVILLGGEGCLTNSIETELDSLSLDWERIGGKTRYETSVLLAEKVSSDWLIIANGDNYPDALSAASYAGINQIPIVLTSNSLPSAVAEYCQETEPKHIIVVGGEGAVSTESLNQFDLTIETRLGGQNRYETNAKVVDYMQDSIQTNDLFLASGLNFPDAIAGTVLASKFKAPLLLTDTDDIPPAVYSIMRENMQVEPSTTNNTCGQGKITASGGLNLRENPSMTGEILLTIPNGATVPITGSQDEWSKTIYNGEVGWIYSEYVTIMSEESTESIDLTPNGKVYILGGSGVISENTQNIVEGKAYSAYTDNLKNFAALPSSLTESDSQTVADSTNEVLLDPFAGIPDNALQGKKIVIDPGHGGPDPGAIGQSGTYEKNNNLSIALYLCDILTDAGAVVTMTRTEDVSVAQNYTEKLDLMARVDLANNTNADLFISIHNNAGGGSGVNGTATYYSNQSPQITKSAQLADAIQNMVTGKLGTYNQGVKQADFYVLKNTNMPSVLVEVAYISNAYEEARLKNPVFQKNVATTIFQGIYAYYNP